jgi:hypothetical protein
MSDIEQNTLMTPPPMQIPSGATGPVPIQIISGTTGAVPIQIIPETKYESGASCDLNVTAWPSIIIILIGVILVMYVAIAPGVNSNNRVFGVVLLTLWTAMWSIILWVLWRECHQSIAWWLLLIPFIMMILFTVIIVIMNMGM